MIKNNKLGLIKRVECIKTLFSIWNKANAMNNLEHRSRPDQNKILNLQQDLRIDGHR